MTKDQQRQWLARVKREWLAGNLTDKARIVLTELATFASCRFGTFPSHALLAARARCCVRTVQVALQAGRRLGLVEWCHQRVRRAWRILRAVNRYAFKLPTGEVPCGPHGPGRHTTGKSCRGDIQQEKPEASERPNGALAALLEAAKGLPDLLAARREAMEAHWHRLAAERAK